MRLIGGLFALGVYGFFAGILFLAAIFWHHSQGLTSTEQLAAYEPATLSRLHSGDGALMAEFARERRLYTPIDEVPDTVKHAFISAEDKNFFNHPGVDGLALMKAMVDNVFRATSGAQLRGASTITQQVVKNFLLDGRRQISRKIQEMVLAQRLESVLSKDEILELYLNEIFLGVNSYGVTSAALRYFDKRLDELTPQEAAYLAALPKAPSQLHPVRQRERATGRRNYVLGQMLENGYLDEAAYEAAIAAPLETMLDNGPVSVSAAPPLDYFAEEIRRQLGEELGSDALYAGGLSIRATVNPDLQNLARRILQERLWSYSQENGYIGPQAELPDELDMADTEAVIAALQELDAPRDVLDWRLAAVRSVGASGAELIIDTGETATLPFSDVREWAARRDGLDERDRIVVGPQPQGPGDVWAEADVIYVAPTADGGWSMRQVPELNGALVAMDPHTGRVLALQGGFSFQSSEFNRATQAQRQPGSAIKPFVYAAALEHGYQPNTIVLDAPVTLEQLEGELWKPRNYSGRFYGPSPLRVGLEQSQNLMTVRIAMDAGLDTVAGYAERFGVYDDMPPLVSYALGAGETTLLKLSASYAMFVNGGKRIEPTLVDRIQDRHGATVFRHDDRICTECRAEEWRGQPEPYVPDEGDQVMDPVTAYQVVWMLKGVTDRGTAARVGAALPFDVAGKTGTTNDARDAWFVGFSPDMVVGCFVGFDTPRNMGRRASGGSLCAPVFQNFMSEANADLIAAATEPASAGPSADGAEQASGADGQAALSRSGAPVLAFRRPSGVEMALVDRESGCAVRASRASQQFIWEAFRAELAPGSGECPSGGIVGGGGFDTVSGGGFDAAIDRALAPGGGLTAGQQARRDALGDIINGDAASDSDAAPADAAAPAAPRRPRPPANNVGLGSGGLY